MWGARAGQTYSASASDRNLQQVVSELLGELACAMLFGMMKCHEMVGPRALLREGQATGPPC
eukprot:5772521-Pyramimonas_sp.AAC.1